MRTTARNIQTGDLLYSREHDCWDAVVAVRQHAPAGPIMVDLHGDGNGYPYAPNEIVSIQRRSWHQGMVNALLDSDRNRALCGLPPTNLQPYMEDDMIYVDFAHAAAVVIGFNGTGNGYTAVATAWAPDHGVDHEHVIVDGALLHTTAAAVIAFLIEQARHEAEVAAALGEGE